MNVAVCCGVILQNRGCAATMSGAPRLAPVWLVAIVDSVLANDLNQTVEEMVRTYVKRDRWINFNLPASSKFRLRSLEG